MAEVVNWGVLGASNFALNHMAPAIHAATGARLAALGTSSPEKAAAFRAFAPDLAVHDGYEALLADPAIEAVYIPLPHHLHVDWAIRALEAGKHVLVEKPVALSARDIDPLIAARDASRLTCHEAFMIVHHPQWRRARDLVAGGAIGTLAHVDALFCYNNAADAGNIRNDKRIGGGSLPDIGVYTIGSTRFVTGREPEVVSVDVTREDGLEVTARVGARLGDASAHWLTSMRMGPEQIVTIIGSEGRIRLTTPYNAGVFGEAGVDLLSGGETRVWRWPGVNHYILQVEAFGRTLREGADYPWSLEDARASQGVIDAIHAAEL